MSGYSGNLKKGGCVIHKDKLKIVNDWFFVSASGHNNDEIIVSFTDGSSQTGLYNIYTKEEIEKEIKELNKKLKLFPKN